MFSFHYKDLDYSHKIDRASSPSDEYWKHMHPFNEIVYFVSGNVTYTVEADTRVLKPGDLIFIKAGKFHFATVDKGSNYERYVFKFPDEILSSHLLEVIAGLQAFTSTAGGMDNPFTSVDRYVSMNSFEEEDIRSLLIAETQKILIFASKIEDNDESKEDDVSSQIIIYIENHMQNKLSLSEIASALSYSESYLISRFRKKMHCSIMQYVRSKKCILAYKMIKSGGKPQQVAEYLGYDEYSTFYRSYRSVLGFSPGEKDKTYTDS